MRTRRGTVLLVVAGVCALLSALAAAFLMRMRDDADETALVVRQAQARVMLVAGCQYMLEAGRLGWDGRPPDGFLGVSGAHREGHGWIDVRTGAIGPIDQDGQPVWRDATRFPAPGGRAARCPMHLLRRPPFATRLAVVVNPIPGPGDPDVGKPLLREPDPQPEFGDSAASTWNGWALGDAFPRATSTGLAWFRCYRHRDEPARFTITCGAGASEGFRDWNEVVLDGAEQVFGDRATFESLTGVEVRTWYVVEWSAAVATPDYHLLDNIFGEQSSSPHPPGWEGQQPKHIDTYYMQARNSSLASPGRHYLRCQIHTNNPVGTIRWVERLPGPPTSGEW